MFQFIRKGWDMEVHFGGCFSWLGGFKRVIGSLTWYVPTYSLHHTPLLRIVTGFIEAVVEQKMAIQMLFFKGCQQLMGYVL